MKFAAWAFRIAGIYGLLAVFPLYFLEGQIGRDQPPPITHPEFFYGFIGVVLAWQLAFLIIASDPRRYRLLMLPSIVEKATFAAAATVLLMQQRLALSMFAAAMIDAVLGVLFAVAWWQTRES